MLAKLQCNDINVAKLHPIICFVTHISLSSVEVQMCYH
jgi:hypothetical protein